MFVFLFWIVYEKVWADTHMIKEYTHSSIGTHNITFNPNGNRVVNTDAHNDLVTQYTLQKFAIVLTMYNNKKLNPSKYEMYKKRLIKWLEESEFDIYVVNSGGTPIDINHKRLFQYNFDQYNNPIVSKDMFSTTHLESISILQLLDKYDIENKYDFVFKITGKYFIKDFINIVKCLPSDCDIAFQYSRNNYNQNSEVVGSRASLFRLIYERCVKEPYIMEQTLNIIQRENKYKMYTLPSIPIPTELRVKRAAGDELHNL